MKLNLIFDSEILSCHNANEKNISLFIGNFRIVHTWSIQSVVDLKLRGIDHSVKVISQLIVASVTLFQVFAPVTCFQPRISYLPWIKKYMHIVCKNAEFAVRGRLLKTLFLRTKENRRMVLQPCWRQGQNWKTTNVNDIVCINNKNLILSVQSIHQNHHLGTDRLNLPRLYQFRIVMSCAANFEAVLSRCKCTL